jgi:hypothetical protein
MVFDWGWGCVCGHGGWVRPPMEIGKGGMEVLTARGERRRTRDCVDEGFGLEPCLRGSNEVGWNGDNVGTCRYWRW